MTRKLIVTLFLALTISSLAVGLFFNFTDSNLEYTIRTLFEEYTGKTWYMDRDTLVLEGESFKPKISKGECTNKQDIRNIFIDFASGERVVMFDSEKEGQVLFYFESTLLSSFPEIIRLEYGLKMKTGNYSITNCGDHFEIDEPNLIPPTDML